jgi:hypothetical protein
LPTSFGEAKEVGRLPGRDPAWLYGSEDATASSGNGYMPERASLSLNLVLHEKPAGAMDIGW